MAMDKTTKAKLSLLDDSSLKELLIKAVKNGEVNDFSEKDLREFLTKVLTLKMDELRNRGLQVNCSVIVDGEIGIIVDISVSYFQIYFKSENAQKPIWVSILQVSNQ